MGGPPGIWPRGSFLTQIDQDDRAELVRKSTARTYSPGERLLNEGEPSTHAVLLMHGLTKVVSQADGQEVFLAVRVGGDLVGEMGALDGTPRSASIVAITSVLTREISGTAFRAYVEQHVDVALAISRTMSDRLRSANRHRVAYLHLEPRARVCRVLAEIVSQYGRKNGDGWELGVGLSQEDLASLAGMRLRTAQKQVSVLRAEGILHWGYRRITVPDLDRLSREAD